MEYVERFGQYDVTEFAKPGVDKVGWELTGRH